MLQMVSAVQPTSSLGVIAVLSSPCTCSFTMDRDLGTGSMAAQRNL
jgi:hypothetical protein